MAVAKLLLLILSGVAQLYGQTPPNVRPPTEHLREQRGIERGLPFITWLGRALFCVWVLFEAAVLVAFANFTPPTLAHYLSHVLLPSKLLPQAATLTTATPAFTIGSLLGVFGGLLRAYCYRALGAHFTFELSIRPTQALVTHGLYGVIRHPSYTGSLALVLGWQLCVLDRQGVIMSLIASGWDSNIGQAVVTAASTCVWATTVCMLYLWLSKRMNNEDAMLEKNFGEEWRAWAKRVPYRLVPGVY
ncbi:hypothetical protein L210DRAFT_3541315 [Boletus edulis BED1]|uniref:Protein-S-isoprenylcysteine O-methyltransferase n=1 Tax=Boletus edulis BED1 TaxID=1328754 RepID=A0AAD4BU27_BOLED|nr:hypothetical protein L210DRAFT_3541315 [Boletus edulis BED1]